MEFSIRTDIFPLDRFTSHSRVVKHVYFLTFKLYCCAPLQLFQRYFLRMEFSIRTDIFPLDRFTSHSRVVKHVYFLTLNFTDVLLPSYVKVISTS